MHSYITDCIWPHNKYVFSLTLFPFVSSPPAKSQDVHIYKKELGHIYYYYIVDAKIYWSWLDMS